MLPTILIVDDEKHTRDGLRASLEDDYDVYVAADISGAMNVLEADSVDVMVTDLRIGGEDGMQLIDRALTLPTPPICIMMTAYGSVDTAVEAMKHGAYDFITKPLSIDRLEIMIQRALRSRQAEAENRQLRQRVEKEFGLESLIGNSQAMNEVFDIIRQVAPSRATVLIQGESGTGKELVAQAIHNLSGRPKAKFVPVHCAALSPQLLESELFGHEKGAFTGAIERRIGRFEQANGGTLFLDEIGEIDSNIQVKVLRVLGEERAFERVGGGTPIKVDVRLVAATNKNLEQMVAAGTFRDDLFYRLNVVQITLPPLRQRKEDIPLLVNAFLKQFAKENGKPQRDLTADASEAILSYEWPGNVRELRTAIEHGVVMATGARIGLRDLPHSVRQAKQDKGGATSAASFASPSASPSASAAALPSEGEQRDGYSVGQTTSPHLNLHETEHRLIMQALEECKGNRTRAAARLGISRRTLHRRLKEMQIPPRIMAKVQDLIHLIEQGRWAKGVRIIALGAFCFFLAFLFILDPFYRGQFKGITHPTGMEQAAIAKEIAKGNGFASAVVRPLGLAQMKKSEIELPEGPIGDTYMAPGWPTVLAPVMAVFKGKWELGAKDEQYLLDRVIIATSFVFFFLAVWINFYTIRRLFDAKLAMMTVCLTLLAEIYWQYVSSGLPQMWLFFLFSATTYTLARALVAEGERASSEKWLALAAAGMGALTLSLSVCFALFLGALAYFLIRSPHRLRIGLIMGGVYLACVLPWMIRNWSLSGNPFGLGIYSILVNVHGNESAIMRRMSLDGLSFSPMLFRTKLQTGVEGAFSSLYTSLGGCIPACLFLLSFLHRFRNPAVRSLRWLFLCMWAAAVVGMAFVGFGDSGAVRANDITLLFIPVFAAFGMAYLLVQWGRMEIPSPFFRRVFIGAIFALSAIPFFNLLTASGKAFFVMPYRVPSIARLAAGSKPNEIVASDMPWAVAWYANRTGLLFPIEPATLIEMHDYGTLKRPIAGLFLTSISSDTPFLSGVLSPQLRGWYGLLRRDPDATSAPNLRGFPFPALYVSELFGYDCFYTDSVRAASMKLEPEE